MDFDLDMSVQKIVCLWINLPVRILICNTNNRVVALEILGQCILERHSSFMAVIDNDHHLVPKLGFGVEAELTEPICLTLCFDKACDGSLVLLRRRTGRGTRHGRVHVEARYLSSPSLVHLL